ncbi:hypothetical protein RUM43_012872 [Polyplax serrata]|uniref:Uncharacterized protein n=1 Tax=Polyplax serrata TaxID=468196 RepID=A0AAN8P683_POLSC
MTNESGAVSWEPLDGTQSYKINVNVTLYSYSDTPDFTPTFLHNNFYECQREDNVAGWQGTPKRKYEVFSDSANHRCGLSEVLETFEQ